MKWLLIIFILTWLFCSACETTYNKAHDKIEEVAKKTYENNKDSIKKNSMNILVGMRTVLRVLGFGWHKYKK